MSNCEYDQFQLKLIINRIISRQQKILSDSPTLSLHAALVAAYKELPEQQKIAFMLTGGPACLSQHQHQLQQWLLNQGNGRGGNHSSQRDTDSLLVEC